MMNALEPTASLGVEAVVRELNEAACCRYLTDRQQGILRALATQYAEIEQHAARLEKLDHLLGDTADRGIVTLGWDGDDITVHAGDEGDFQSCVGVGPDLLAAIDSVVFDADPVVAPALTVRCPECGEANFVQHNTACAVLSVAGWQRRDGVLWPRLVVDDSDIDPRANAAEFQCIACEWRGDIDELRVTDAAVEPTEDATGHRGSGRPLPEGHGCGAPQSPHASGKAPFSRPGNSTAAEPENIDDAYMEDIGG